MQRYAFEAVDERGVRSKGVELAADEEALDRKLGASGLTLLRARRVSTARQRVSGRVLIDLFYHLSAVLDAGIPMVRGIRDLQRTHQEGLDQELGTIANLLEAGSSLSDALASFPRIFPPVLRAVVRAGERSGNLDVVLRDLADYLEWREDLKRQVRRALGYPVTLTLALLGFGVVLALYVVPRFAEVFNGLGVDLPLMLRAILAVRDFVLTHWLGLLALHALAVAAFVVGRRHEPVARRIDACVLRVPVVGRVVSMLEFSRFAHNLALLFRSGVVIHEALALVRDIVQNRVISGLIEGTALRLRAGAGLAEAVRALGGMPTLVVSMLEVGETTGKLDESLGRVKRFYDRELPATIERAIEAFNTAALIGMGGVILMLALAFFLPLYQLYGRISAGAL